MMSLLTLGLLTLGVFLAVLILRVAQQVEPPRFRLPLGELAAGRSAVSLVPPVRCERALAARAQSACRNRAHAF